jgi:hypothetical protein
MQIDILARGIMPLGYFAAILYSGADLGKILLG